VLLLTAPVGCEAPAGDIDESPALSTPPSAEVLAALRVPAGFRGTLPCADCPGVRTTLELDADGSAILRRLYFEAEDGFDAATVQPARWTTTESGQLVVRPDGGEAIYFGFDRSGLLALDREGRPYDSALPRLLERLPRGEAAELTGTAWAVVESAEPSPAPAVVRFGTEGRMTGGDGCNELIGAWSVRDGTLSITPAATSMRSCDEAVAGRARRFEAALEGATAYRIEEEQLVLLDAGGLEIARMKPIA
jgi:heat shock protein HslJ